MACHFTTNARRPILATFLFAVFAMLAALPSVSQTQVKAADRPAAGNQARPEKLKARPQDGQYPLFLNSYAYSGPSPSEAVVIADVNGDGKPDLIVANAGCVTTCDGTVGVLLGNGDGTYQSPVQYDSGGFAALAVAVGDVNHDGKPDVVLANYYGNCPPSQCEGTVSVLLGNGDGTFQAAVTYAIPGANPDAVALVDLNGDGKLDIVTGNWPEDGIAVLMGNGDGTFQPATVYPMTGGVFGLAIADVNHDGKPDVLAAGYVIGNPDQAVVFVLLGKGDGTFQAVQTYASGAPANYWASAVAVADMNGDGKLDLVVANYQDDVGVLLGKGDGTFQPVVLYSSGGLAVSVAVTDVEGNGTHDVIVGNDNGSSSGSVGVLLGNGDGTLQPVVNFSPLNAWFVAAGDLNGDGRPDVAVASLGGDVDLLFNDTGPHTATTTAVTSSQNPALNKGSVTYTATIASQSGTATGTVSFTDNGTAIGTGGLYNNQAWVTTVYKRKQKGNKGLHTIVANYSGDLHNAFSTGSLIEGVGSQPFPSLTALATSGSPSQLGQPVTFTATVTSPYYSSPIPDGELVTFSNGSVEIGTGTTTGGVAAFTTSSLTARKHTIKATYSGDSIFKKSTGKVTQVVQK